jgi:hypothetical protein
MSCYRWDSPDWCGDVLTDDKQKKKKKTKQKKQKKQKNKKKTLDILRKSLHLLFTNLLQLIILRGLWAEGFRE